MRPRLRDGRDAQQTDRREAPERVCRTDSDATRLISGNGDEHCCYLASRRVIHLSLTSRNPMSRFGPWGMECPLDEPASPTG